MDSTSIQTAVYRLSARLHENLSETARDLGLQGLDAANLASSASSAAGGAAGAGAAGKYLEDGAVVTDEGIRETKKLLETRRDASMTEGLRRVLAMMSKGHPVLTFFPQVVQCLSSSSSSTATGGMSSSGSSSTASSLQIRSLVSLYILRQARLEPDLALLPVNMYQKDLRDPNPVVRALALRTLAGMGLDSIAALVVMSLKTASRDSNWFVRRTVAESLDRVFALDPSHITSLIPILQTLIADRNPLVLGTALAALENIAPGRNDLLHSQYRRLCRSLVDTDEWSQVVMLRVLERYARCEFSDPEGKGSKLDRDLELLLKCAEPLFFNRNAAVVLAAVRVYHRLAPASWANRYIGPLLRLLQAQPEVQAVVLANIAVIAASRPALFSQPQHLSRFYISQSMDAPVVQNLKLQILILLVTKENIRVILSELMEYIRSPDEDFVGEVVRSIGQCGSRITAVTHECIKVLLRLVLKGGSQLITHRALLELHRLISAASAPADSQGKTLVRLITAFHNRRITSAASRAAFFGLVAEFLHLLSGSMVSAVDVLRVGVRTFQRETEAAKSSLLLLSTKLILLSSSSPPPFLRQVHILHAYVTALGRYDASWAIRDLTRFYVALVKEAGIEVQAEDEGNAVEEEAFARGDFVAGNAAAHDENASLGGESGDAVGRELRRKEAVADQERTRAALRTVLLSGPLKQTKDVRSVTEREEDGTRRTLASEQLLGTFALSARFGKSTVATAAPAMGGDAAEVLPVLSGWSPLPGWAASSSPSALRDPPADVDDDGGGTRSSSTSFTNAPFSKTSRSKARSARDAVQRSASPRLREQVVLVPTESDPSAYARQEVPRTKGLQEFLESESEDGEEDDEGTEEEDESDSESESEEEEVDCGQPRKPAAVGLAAKEKEDDDDDDESESSSEEDDEEMQSDAAVMPAAGQKQPLLASQ